jgi:cell division protein FtsB
MKEFQTKRRWRRMLFSWPVAITLILAVVWLLSLIAREYLAVKIVKKEEARLEEKLTLLEEKNKTMEGLLKNINSASGLEKIIRERFNVKKPGEEVLVVLNKEEKKADGESAKQGFFVSLWLAVKNLFNY